MNHERSLQSLATERYLLGEMSELERHQFEEHYFSCAECAESVRTAALLADNARAAFAAEAIHPTPARPARSWLDWLRVPVLAPAALAAVLACVVGYQSLVEVPALRRGLSAQAIEPVALVSASRGSEPVIPVGDGPGFFSVAVFVAAQPQSGELSYTLVNASGAQAAAGPAQAPAPGRPLILLIPNSAVTKGGRYTLLIRQSGHDAGEFPFVASGR